MQIDFDFLDFPSLNGNNSNEKKKILKLCSVKRLGAKKNCFCCRSSAITRSSPSSVRLQIDWWNSIKDCREWRESLSSTIRKWWKIDRKLDDFVVICLSSSAIWMLYDLRLNWNVKSNLCSIWIQHFAYIFSGVLIYIFRINLNLSECIKIFWQLKNTLTHKPSNKREMKLESYFQTTAGGVGRPQNRVSHPTHNPQQTAEHSFQVRNCYNEI